MSRRNQYNRAVGLQYNGPKAEAPTVILKSDADIADRVVRLARRYNVPIVEDAELARAMSSIPVDDHVPEELYQAVAAVLVHLGQRRKR